ncbi:MAG: metal ABC transporter permease [Planctomycetota bacterium]
MLLQDYNTRTVIVGTTLLGLAAGIVGTYMLLRRRALVGDALSHATLPGIGLAFIVMVELGGSGKFLPGLLLGAAASGLAGAGLILLIRHATRIKEDAALGIVLSATFGLGIALLGVIQSMPTGNQAGLESFIYGKTASMLRSDAILIGITAAAIIVTCTVLYKEFACLSFDSAYAAAQGWPIGRLDAAMMMLVCAVTVIGLQAVGLILVIAMLIIPAAAARFWTDHLRTMLVTSGAIGAASGLFGSALSAVVPRLPAGAIIVVVAAAIFALSLAFGTRRGLIVRSVGHVRLRRRVRRQHLLRAMYEWLEAHDAIARPADAPTPLAALRAERSWSGRALRRALRRGRQQRLVEPATPDGQSWRLTPAGLEAASRITRNHRLWEIFLVTHADIAPSHVDRNADQIEHVLAPDLVRRLESLLAAAPAAATMPPSPHEIAPVEGGRESAR